VQDVPFGVPVACGTGGCDVDTTTDALMPNLLVESRRTIWAVRSLLVRDPGADGDLGSTCPIPCGTGDETRFLDQGVFLP
jgi:hypothetical protein